MSPRYFTGTSVQGSVRASVAQTFREVVDTFRICPKLGIARAPFLALEKSKRDGIKQVPFFVPAVFKESPSKRVTDQALHCNLVFLDVDPEKHLVNGKWVENGNYPAAPFTNDPNSLYTALAGFNFAAHLTASSTPEKPRMRIVVDAEGIPLARYPQAAMKVASMLGLSSVTKESRVSVQPMYLPVNFSDSTEEEHPLIAFSLDGRAFTVDDIGDVHEPNGSNGNGKHESRSVGSADSLDALDFLRAPVPEITLVIAKEALFNIDADLSRDEWLNCAMALKHQFSPHRTDEAYELFDEWSATAGTKYGGTDETKRLWDSVRQSPNGRMPITIHSLLKTAVAAGWDDKKVKQSGFTSLVNWMDEVASVTELMEQGVMKILTTPLLSPVQEEMLVDQLRQHAKKRFSYTVSSTAIRKTMVQTKAEIKAREKPPEKGREPLWAKGVYYVSQPNEFCRHRTGEKYKTEAFDNMYARRLLPTEESLREAGLPVTPATLSKPIVPPSDYFLNFLEGVRAYDYAYDPSRPTEVFFVNQQKTYLNSYSPTYPEADPKNAAEAGEVLQRHLANLIAEPEYRRTFMDFLAFMVQQPGVKIRWAVLIQSAEGAGKTFFAKVMQAVLGFDHVKILSDGAIKKGYNEWAFGHQLVAVEEIYVAGINRHVIMNAIKPLITNDDISIDEKYRSNRQVANISNYMLFSNHHDALALTPNDRRYFVVKSPLQHKDQVMALGGKDYFITLFDYLKNHPGAMRSVLLDWEISPDFQPNGHAPRTIYVNDMVQDSANDLTAAVRRLLSEGDYPLVQSDIVSSKALMDVLRLEEGTHKASVQQLGSVLREEGYHQIGRHLIGTERHYLWVRRGVDEKTAVQTAQKRQKAEGNPDGQKEI